jgi:hypothetical protein
MIRNYKLAANFNTVEFEITDDMIIDALMPAEIGYDENDELVFSDESAHAAIKRILQREYDMLASIKVINIAPDIKQAAQKQVNPPSEKQAAWAEALGMIDPMKHDKKEVWAFIQKHKDD